MNGAISPVDSMYFNNAFNYPNIAFMGAQQNAQAQLQAYQQMLKKYEAAADATRVDNTSAVASNMAFKGKAKEESSNTGLYVFSAAALLAGATYCAVTKQNPWQAAKTLGGKLKNLFTGKGGSVSDKIKAVMTEDGWRYVIDGKTTTLNSKELTGFAKKNGIDLEALKKITEGTTKVTSGSFDFTEAGSKGRKLIVSFADGKITGIRDTDAKKIITDLVDTATTKKDQNLIKALQQRVATITNMEKGYDKISGLRKINYSNTIGNDTLNFARSFSGGTSIVNPYKLTSLQRFEQSANEIQALIYDNKKLEKILNIAKDTKGIPEGWKIESYPFMFDDNGKKIEVLFKNGQIEGLKGIGSGKDAAKIFDKTTPEFKAYLLKDGNEKLILDGYQNHINNTPFDKLAKFATFVMI